MTDFADSCFGCGGHRRKNVWSSKLCPECTTLYERGEITMFGGLVPDAEKIGDPLLRRRA